MVREGQSCKFECPFPLADYCMQWIYILHQSLTSNLVLTLGIVTLGPGRYKRRLDCSKGRSKGLPLRIQVSRRTPEVQGFLRKRRLNSTTKTKRDPGTRDNDPGIFKGVSSRSKLERQYRKYNGLYRKGESARTK